MFQPCLSWETENPCKFFIYKGLSSSSCTQTRGRTGMEVNPLVFETSASTDSAIWAYWFLKCGAKIRLFFETCKSFYKKKAKKVIKDRTEPLPHLSENKPYFSRNILKQSIS